MSAENHEGEHKEEGPGFFALLWELLKEPKGDDHGGHHDVPHEAAGHDDHAGDDAHAAHPAPH